MTVVSDESMWWPTINFYHVNSYFQVACLIIVVYDWALTFSTEFELVLRRRWSLMTVLYLSLRYIGLSYNVILLLMSLPNVSFTDTGCLIMGFVTNWTGFVVSAIVGVIMVIRLHAMYQQSRKMLFFLVVNFIALQIASVLVIGVMESRQISGGEFILSGVHLCGYNFVGDGQFLSQVTWILSTIWEILALCLAVWIAIKHFRGSTTRWTVEDCFTALMKTHVFYFASFFAVSCLQLSFFSPKISDFISAESEFLNGFFRIADVMQKFVLAPRLILGIRESHAELVVACDEGTSMISIAFQERARISAGDSV